MEVKNSWIDAVRLVAVHRAWTGCALSRSQSCRVGMWASEDADEAESSDRCAAYFVGVLPNDLVVAEGLILNPSSNARPGW